MSLSEEIKKEVAVKVTTKIALIAVGIIAIVAAVAVLYYNPFNWNISLFGDRSLKIADTKKNIIGIVRVLRLISVGRTVMVTAAIKAVLQIIEPIALP